MSIASIILPKNLGAGAASLLALTSLAAHADVIRADGLNQTIVPLLQVVTSGVLTLDVDHNGTADVSLANTNTFYDYHYIFSDYRATVYDRSITVSGQGVGAGAVAAGTLIGPSLTMSTTSTLDITTNTRTTVYMPGHCTGKAAPSGAELPCGSGQRTRVTSHITNDNIGANLLVPFQFSHDQQTQYGWLDVTLRDRATEFGNPTPIANIIYEVTLNGYGYDNTGAAVAAGAAAFTSPVPEPSSLLMLATGLAGMAAYRRKGRARRADAALPA